ncbi:putative alpha-ketoglutarate-dependent sulfonate dioxygenase [Grifola frondosa]|uniref:Putative alpha-ketoglutarate-dependent sulfonate dioxygenase n=1 Tax=Grifola frondosa TaxID=5627 RepID=A0A1C7LQ56_GRIFR|nr:putative alpha-ketoglutarate-dependent sulfonate dioxygenase [Grifola frondosa]
MTSLKCGISIKLYVSPYALRLAQVVERDNRPYKVATADNASNGSVSTAATKVFNPFYSPPVADDDGKDASYKFANYKPFYPDVKWEPLGDIKVTERAVPELDSCYRRRDFRHRPPPTDRRAKDELALLVAERGVVFLRDQEISIREQLELARHYGPLHKHATTPSPGSPAWKKFTSSSTTGPAAQTLARSRSSTSGTRTFRPPYGGDTLWSSGYALYSSFSPGFQKPTVRGRQDTRYGGSLWRRSPIVRVHPATGWKAVYVNPGFTRRIVGVPKAESDAILELLFHQISDNPDFQVRFHWEPNSIAIWDNRVVTHSATFDFYPHTRHALRATPHGEKPLSVEAYERQGKVAKDRQLVIWEQQGISVQKVDTTGAQPRGYSD